MEKQELQKAIQIRDRLKKAIIARHTQTNQGSYWHSSTKRLAEQIGHMHIYAMPWNTKDIDDMKIDYRLIESTIIPPIQFIIALPNITGIPGLPTAEFLILCTPLDQNALLFETLVDISTAINQQEAIEKLAALANTSLHAAKERFSMPQCVTFHSAIIEMDRREDDFNTIFNAFYIKCDEKKEEMMLRGFPAYEPFTKCTTCSTFDQIMWRSGKCYLHTTNTHAIAHLIVKVLQATQHHTTITNDPQEKQEERLDHGI